VLEHLFVAVRGRAPAARQQQMLPATLLSFAMGRQGLSDSLKWHGM